MQTTTDYPAILPVGRSTVRQPERPDVLVYQTEPLDDDLTIAGPLKAILHVSTTGTDADWVIKVIDVYSGDFPDPNPNPAQVRMGGYQQLVRGDVFRGKFRKSFEKPEPFEPGKPDSLQFTLPDVSHVPPTSPSHGPNPRFMVPFGGSQSSNIRRYFQCST